MKKVKSYNLEEAVIKAIDIYAKEDQRSASDWLNKYLCKSLSKPLIPDRPKKIEKRKFNFKESLLELGVDPVVLSDWLEVRKKKKAANTETAFKALLTEINKSGLPVDVAIAMSAGNSWSGFRASWINKATHTGKTTGNLQACEAFINE